MNNIDNKFIYFIEELGVLSIVSIFLNRNKIKEIHYLKSSKIGNLFIKILSKKISRINQILIRKKDIWPDELILKIKDKAFHDDKIRNPSEMFYNFIEYFFKIYKRDFYKEKFVLFFFQELAKDIVEAFQIFDYIDNIDGNNIELTKQNNYRVLLKRSCWNDTLKSYFKEKNLDVESYYCLNDIVLIFYITFRLFFELIINLILILSFKKIKIKKDGNPKVGVFYTHGVDLDRRNDIFWFLNSKIDPEDVIIYFLHYANLPTQETYNIIESLKLKSINILPYKINLRPVLPCSMEINRFPDIFYIKHVFRAIFLNLKIFFFMFFNKNKDFYLWFWSKFIRHIDDICLFESFFNHFNIKIHYGLFETGRHMSAANIAINLSKGVDIAHHWSNYDCVNLVISKPHEVYFTWGQYYKENLFNNGFYLVKNYVYTGYPYDFTFKLYYQESKTLREQLQSKGAKFIVTFFDQTLTPFISNWNNAVKNMYKELLNKVILDKELVIIAKPKRIAGEDDLIRIFPELKELINNAIKTERFIVLDRNKFPCQAAMVSDLTIGFGVTTTASLESALVGVRSITYDCEMLSEHPIFKEGYNRILFTNLEELFKAIDKIRNDYKTTLIGDYSFILKQIDPFQDGKANERMGFYIKNLLDGFNLTIDREIVLKEANKNYINKYGNDKIATV